MAFRILLGILLFAWAAWLISLLRLWSNLRIFRRIMGEAPAPARWPRVSIVVPARDEEAQIGLALESMACLDYPDYEVIVVDDGSTDRTAEIVRALAERHDRIRLFAAPPVPEGWLGKCHALQFGASKATGEWIVFTDADVRHAPGSLRHAIAAAEAQRVDFLTLAPLLEAGGPAEGAILPLVYFWALCALDARLIHDPNSDFAMGSGAFNLVRTKTYWALGGHEPIRLAVIDDAMLAVLMKVNGVAIGEADGRRMIRVRMYHGLRSIVGGLRKNAYAAVVSLRSANALAAAALATIYVAPLPACVVALIWGHGAAAYAAAALGGALYVIISLILRRMTQVVDFRPRYAFAHPLAMCALTYIGALSWFDGLVRREVRWRGRVYPSLPKGVGRAAILPRRGSH